VKTKLAYETERIRERLRTHPVTKDLLDQVACSTSFFSDILSHLFVDDYICVYDRDRNVELKGAVRFEHPSKQDKKRKKTIRAPLRLEYSYTRGVSEDGEMAITFKILSSTSAESSPKEFVSFEMSSTDSYPRSFYEMRGNEVYMSDDDEEEEDGSVEGIIVDEEEDSQEPVVEEEPSDEANESFHKKSSMKTAVDEDEDGNQEEEEEEGDFGEELRGFNFDDEALEDILIWIKDEEIDPADVIAFLLALPFYEDEWLLDERICEILFSSGGRGSEYDEKHGHDHSHHSHVDEEDIETDDLELQVTAQADLD
jgi:hypothetical protein